MSDPKMVSLAGLSKGFGVGETRVEVLKDLDIEVEKGQMLAVVGPSGVGKSTLLHIIGLLDRPDEGRLELGGREVGRLDREARAHLRNRMIGFVFQHHYLLDELDALDNVALPLRIAGDRPGGGPSSCRGASRGRFLVWQGAPLSGPALGWRTAASRCCASIGDVA